MFSDHDRDSDGRDSHRDQDHEGDTDGGRRDIDSDRDRDRDGNYGRRTRSPDERAPGYGGGYGDEQLDHKVAALYYYRIPDVARDRFAVRELSGKVGQHSSRRSAEGGRYGSSGLIVDDGFPPRRRFPSPPNDDGDRSTSGRRSSPPPRRSAIFLDPFSICN